MSTKPATANAGDLRSSELLAALRNWRRHEKRHACMCLGELGGDIDQAKQMAERSLHNVRIQADRLLSADECLPPEPEACYRCQGRGNYNGDGCEWCDGTGEE